MQSLVELEELDLARNYLSESCARTFEKLIKVLPRLSTLKVSHNHLTTAVFKGILNGFAALETTAQSQMHQRQDDVDDDEDDEAALKPLKPIVLDLSNNDISMLPSDEVTTYEVTTADVCAKFATLRNDCKIDLSGNGSMHYERTLQHGGMLYEACKAYLCVSRKRKLTLGIFDGGLREHMNSKSPHVHLAIIELQQIVMQEKASRLSLIGQEAGFLRTQRETHGYADDDEVGGCCGCTVV